MGYVGAFFFIARPKEHEYSRHPRAVFGKIFAGDALIVDQGSFITEHFCGGFPGDLYHFIVVDQRDVLVDDLDLTGAAISFADLFYDSYESFRGLLIAVGTGGVKKPDGPLQPDLVGNDIAFRSAGDFAEHDNG